MFIAYAVVVLSSLSTSVGDKSGPADKMAFLERFAGEWAVDGKWADGQTLNARSVYTWGLGKKILVAKTFVNDKGKEYQRYEGVMAWHPEKRSLFQISFAFDGSLTQVLMEQTDKDTLKIGWAPFTEGKPSPLRQTIRFLDNDRFQWIVTIREGETWKQLIDATWKRKAK